jgi:hypothetical protein
MDSRGHGLRHLENSIRPPPWGWQASRLPVPNEMAREPWSFASC